jgi:hypothetical protein
MSDFRALRWIFPPNPTSQRSPDEIARAQVYARQSFQGLSSSFAQLFPPQLPRRPRSEAPERPGRREATEPLPFRASARPKAAKAKGIFRDTKRTVSQRGS